MTDAAEEPKPDTVEEPEPDTVEEPKPATVPHPEPATAEERIAALTAELDATNRGVVALLAELEQARGAEAQALADQQVTAERERIANDLYQQVIHKMFGAGLALQGTVSLIQQRHAADRVRAVIADLDGIIADLRAAVFGAFEPREAGTGLRLRFAEIAAGPHGGSAAPPTIAIRGPIDETVPDDLAAEVLSAARTLLAALSPAALAPEILLEADTGLTLALSFAGPVAEETHALRALRARAEARGGRLDVGAAEDARVRMLWWVPLAGEGRDSA